MKDTEIAVLIAALLVEEAFQPPLSKAEFPELLFECLCFDLMTRLPGRPTPIELGNPQLEGNEMAETYAASLPADLSVNRPPLPHAMMPDASLPSWVHGQ